MNARMDEIKRLIREKEQAKAAIEKEIERLKIELADLVLSGEGDFGAEPKETEDVIRFVSVVFKAGGKVYDYIWNGPEPARVGDTVQVESRWNGWTKVEVVDVFQKAAALCDGDYSCAYPLTV